MDSTLFNKVFSYLSEKAQLWEPNGIVLSTSVGEVNLLDYIKGGTAGDEGHILFDNAPLSIDPSEQNNQKALMTSVKNACTEAGI
jgi:hypothetical protein